MFIVRGKQLSSFWGGVVVVRQSLTRLSFIRCLNRNHPVKCHVGLIPNALSPSNRQPDNKRCPCSKPGNMAHCWPLLHIAIWTVWVSSWHRYRQLSAISCRSEKSHKHNPTKRHPSRTTKENVAVTQGLPDAYTGTGRRRMTLSVTICQPQNEWKRTMLRQLTQNQLYGQWWWTTAVGELAYDIVFELELKGGLWLVSRRSQRQDCC